MELSSLETDFIWAYRSMDEQGKLAVRCAVCGGDMALLRRLFGQQEDEPDNFGVITRPRRDYERPFIGR